jgi:hypothetical protein
MTLQIKKVSRYYKNLYNYFRNIPCEIIQKLTTYMNSYLNNFDDNFNKITTKKKFIQIY